MKQLVTLTIVSALLFGYSIFPLDTSFETYSSLKLSKMDETIIVRHAGGAIGYPVTTHSRTFNIEGVPHSIPMYITEYDCANHKVKFLSGTSKNDWMTISKNSEEQPIFEFACFTED